MDQAKIKRVELWGKLNVFLLCIQIALFIISIISWVMDYNITGKLVIVAAVILIGVYFHVSGPAHRKLIKEAYKPIEIGSDEWNILVDQRIKEAQAAEKDKPPIGGLRHRMEQARQQKEKELQAKDKIPD